jgi:hypothetical protein
MAINREGLVTTDFTAMADMSGFIPQHQSGGATQEITATQGVVEALRTAIQMDAGPGVFAIWTDSSRYRCDADSFTLTNRDPVEGTDVSIRFASAS